MIDQLTLTISTWMLVGVAISVAIKLSSGPLEAYWARIPAAFRPAIAALIGMLGTFSGALIIGRTWREALIALVLGGVVTGAHATSSSVATGADRPTTPPTT